MTFFEIIGMFFMIVGHFVIFIFTLPIDSTNTITIGGVFIAGIFLVMIGWIVAALLRTMTNGKWFGGGKEKNE